MELRHTFVIYICLAVVLLLIFLSFLDLHKKQKFSKGKKIVIPDYLKDEKYYQKKKVIYRILKIVTGIACVVAVCASAVIMARPYTQKTIVETKYSRDIFLCMDISTSVDALNEQLVTKLKGVVEELTNERVGIVIFNTSPIILCPLTDDYEYVISVLDQVAVSLAARQELYALIEEDEDFSMEWDDYYEWIRLDNFISSGTLVGNEERGSSIIGDGLAATAYDFPELKEDTDRVRIIIFSSDNDIQGTPLVTLGEAADICKENNILVYGIGTNFMLEEDRVEMKQAVEKTGGRFYLEEESGTMAQIVDDINRLGLNMIESEKYCVESEHPNVPVIILTISVALMFVFIKFAKR